jgi:hypothetical protein
MESSDYKTAIVICFVSLAAGFMATQSCVIGMKFAQGFFEPQNLKKASCLARFVSMLMLTFVGAILFIPIELIDNLCKIAKLPGLLVGGTKGVECVDHCFVKIKSKLTGLNAYQLKSLEQQRVVTALLFENLPFTLLLFAIKTHFL